MFLENEFYLMNKDDRILRFTCDNSPLGVSFKEEEFYEEIRPYGYDGIGQWISQRQAPKHRQYIADLLRMCGCYNLDGFIRVTHAPVSYTHLDVYKRQGERCEEKPR